MWELEAGGSLEWGTWGLLGRGCWARLQVWLVQQGAALTPSSWATDAPTGS